MPSHVSLLFSVVLGVAVSASPVAAQTCRGGAPVGKDRPGWLRIQSNLRSDVTSASVEAGGAGEHVFGGGGLQWNSYDDPNGGTWQINGTYGYQVAARPDNRFMFCPIATVTYENASALFADGVHASAIESLGGVSVGIVTYATPVVQVVPTAALFIGASTIRLTFGEQSETDTAHFGLVQVGVGLIYRRSSITPLVSRTFGDASDTTISFVYGYSFGGR